MPVLQGGFVSSVFFLSRKQHVVTAGNLDKHIKIWNLESRRIDNEVAVVNENSGSLPGIGAMALSSDGRTLAAVSYANIIHFIDLETKKVTDILKVHSKSSKPYRHSLVFSPDGKRLASAGGTDNTTVVMDVQKKKVLYRVTGDPSGVMPYVAWSRDGKLLATGGFGRDIIFWDARTGDFISRMNATTAPIFGLAFSPKDDILATVGGDSVMFWRTDTKEFITGFQHKRVSCLAFSTDGMLLITGSNDRFEPNAKIWVVPTK